MRLPSVPAAAAAVAAAAALPLLAVANPLAGRSSSRLRYRQSEPLTTTATILAAAVANASSADRLTVPDFGFDGLKVSPFNSTAYEWWYFDAISSDQLSSIVAIFFIAPGGGFITGLPDDTILMSQLSLTTPTLGHGTLIEVERLATGAVVNTTGQGASGNWVGTGLSFGGESDLSVYTINVDMEGDDGTTVTGSIDFKSMAPPTVPGGLVQAGACLEIMPGVGWASAVPDADAVVSLAVNGSAVAFTAVGYHDKNWGVVPFVDQVASWYWGHGRLGPYSAVWYDAVDPSGAEHVSGYVARDGAVVFAGASGVRVRPVGGRDQYPPRSGDFPTGYHVVIDMGSEGVLEFDVGDLLSLVEDGDVYRRSRAAISGGLRGSGQNYTGTSMTEQFSFVPQPDSSG